MTEAINLAHDERRPFCLILHGCGWWAVIPNNMDRLPKEVFGGKG